MLRVLTMAVEFSAVPNPEIRSVGRRAALTKIADSAIAFLLTFSFGSRSSVARRSLQVSYQQLRRCRRWPCLFQIGFAIAPRTSVAGNVTNLNCQREILP